MIMRKVKILIADDHELVRLALTKLLASISRFEIMSPARSGQQAVQFALESKPDLVLMDIDMPEMNGFEATKKMIRHLPNIKIIILTTFEEAIFFQQALAAGAVGYMTKSSSPHLLLDCIDQILAGKTYLTPAMAQKIALHNVSDEIFPLNALTHQEMQIALKIASGLDGPTIANALHLSRKTIHGYRYRLFKKLNVENDVQLALLFVKYGLTTA
jgi:two-component system, NarL family, invasion response regulator UvrY